MRVFSARGTRVEKPGTYGPWYLTASQVMRKRTLYSRVKRECGHQEQKRRTKPETPAPELRDVLRYLIERERPSNECYRLCACG